MKTVINVRFHKRRTFCTQLSGCHLFKKMLAIVEIKLLVARFLNYFPLVRRSGTSLCVTSVCDIQVKAWTGELPKFCLEWNDWLGAEIMSGVL